MYQSENINFVKFEVFPSFILKSLPLFITTIGRFSSLSAKSVVLYSMAPKNTPKTPKMPPKSQIDNTESAKKALY